MDNKKENKPVETIDMHAILSGAIFDFSGFLTTRKEELKTGANNESAEIVPLVRAFLKKRGVNSKNANVMYWQNVI